MPEYVVGRRVTRYETAAVEAGSREEAVALARREGRFGGAFEEAEYDVFESARADVVELAGRRGGARDRPDALRGAESGSGLGFVRQRPL